MNEDTSARTSHRQACVAAVQDVKTWASCSLSQHYRSLSSDYSRIQIFTIILILINGSGTISYFLPTLMTSLGYTARNAQCEFLRFRVMSIRRLTELVETVFTVPVYIVSLVISLATGYSADRFNSKAIHFAASCAYGTVAFIICATVDNPTVK